MNRDGRIARHVMTGRGPCGPQVHDQSPKKGRSLRGVCKRELVCDRGWLVLLFAGSSPESQCMFPVG